MLRFLEYQSSDTISQALGIDKKIVSNYKNAILRKLGLNSMAELIHIYNNWNDCFCCFEGTVMEDAIFLPRIGTNELKMIRRGNKHVSEPAFSPLYSGTFSHIPAIRAGQRYLLTT
ncbi:LuxR C-terminal-related transcriptional regulator [Kosakonia sp. LAM2021]|nr:LuxR C-terminal-related transcriptional regulator [Kosakonia sp. LAM2021]